MKKAAFLVCALAFLSLACYGQDIVQAAQKGKTATPPSSSLKKIAKPVNPLEIKGKIDSILAAEPAKGIRPEIVITGEDGKTYVFVVRSTTTIYNQDWKAITLDKLEKGQLVRIQYITSKDGMLVALSIKPVSLENPAVPKV